MVEPQELTRARSLLARAEMNFDAQRALDDLETALALLQEVIDGPDTGLGQLARNLGATYANKVHDSVRASLRDAHVPEPRLEHLFNLVRAFDGSELNVPSDSRDLKIVLARRLIELYLEGYSPERKEEAVQELLKIARS